MHSAPKKVLKDIFALCLGLLAALALGELCCRYLLPISTVCYLYDQDIGTTLSPNRTMRWTNRLDYDNWVTTNSQGFHDTEHGLQKQAGTYRILVLGDSFIEALQLPIAKTFTKILETRLNQRINRPKIEVINLGLSGRGPAQYYRILEKKGLAYNPDLVVMAVLPNNDFSDSYPEFSNYSYKPYYRMTEKNNIELIPFSIPPWYSPRSLFTHSSMAYFFVYEILKRPDLAEVFIRMGLLPAMQVNPPSITREDAKVSLPFGYGLYLKNPSPEWQEAYEITLRMIREARNLAQKNGALFYAFAIPDLLRTREDLQKQAKSTYKDFSLDFDKPYKEIAKYCQTWEIPFVDMSPFFVEDFKRHQQPHTWAHDGHWNERGHALGADIMVAPLARVITNTITHEQRGKGEK